MAVCKFIPTRKTDDILQIINFVYEENTISSLNSQISASYVMCLVTNGTGILKMLGREYELKKDSLFIIFPSIPYEIINQESLSRIYITYRKKLYNYSQRLIITTSNCAKGLVLI